MSDFVEKWIELIEGIERGWRLSRRSDRVSLLPQFERLEPKRTLYLNFDVNWPKPTRIVLKAVSDSFTPKRGDKPGWHEIVENGLKVYSGDTVYFDGLKLEVAPNEHEFKLERRDNSNDMRYEITLRLKRASLSPVLAESNLRRFAQRNMSAAELELESRYFSANCGESVVVVEADADADFIPTLQIVCEGAQPGRDMAWTVTLRAAQRYATGRKSSSIQVNHAPFIVSQLLQPAIAPEAGEILAQWKSDDPEGAQWRFGMETVSLHFPPQAVGEAMVRGTRFRPAGEGSPLAPERPIPYSFSRRTELTVRPSRLDRHYTVHPGDTLSILRDAELEHMVTELAYPLELTYRRTPELLRTVILSEVGKAMGQPAMALPDDNPDRAFSKQLGLYLGTRMALGELVKPQRQRHLAARQSFMNRLAQFTLKDANYPRRQLDLREGLSARLRGTSAGARAVYPLPDGVDPGAELVDLGDFIDQEDPQDGRKLPIGLLYSLEFASELGAVLRSPVSTEVHLLELTLSALGATGAMQAAFDEGRTVFDVQVENGQLSRLVKTRYGRIAAVWNKARHVVVYTRSTVAGAQFQGEQRDELFVGRPLLRKMDEYVEIIEAHRQFDMESSAGKNKTGCLHAYNFATRRIYVNSAWGRDVGGGYEIPLFNPLDGSGFYIRPWMGPIARGGGDDLVQHWHEQPEHMYFYTSTKAGAGADTDRWEARPDIDCDSNCSFAAIGAVSRGLKQTAAMLAQRQVPALTLQVAANPRFTMAVRAEGLSNIVHGRGNEELVAGIRTMQIERTTATSRVDFGSRTPLSLKLAAQAGVELEDLAATSQVGADLRSIEATVRGLLGDAKMLWDLLKGDNIASFKQRLNSEVDRAFDECRQRLESSVAKLPVPHNEVVLHLAKGLGMFQQMPDQLVDTACAQGLLAVADLRLRLSKLPGTASEMVARWKALEGEYALMPVRVLLQRNKVALDAPVKLIDVLHQQLARVSEETERYCNVLASQLNATRSDLAILLAATDPTGFKQLVMSCLGNAKRQIAEQQAELDGLLGLAREIKLPPEVKGLLDFRDYVVRLPGPVRTHLKQLMALIDQIEKSVGAETDFDKIQQALKNGIADALTQAEAAVQLLPGELRQALAKTTPLLKAAQQTVGKLQHDLVAGSSAALGALFAADTAYALLLQRFDTYPGDVAAAVGDFDEALKRLEAVLVVPPDAKRARLASEVSEVWTGYLAYLDGKSELSELARELDAAAESVTQSLRSCATDVQNQLEKRRDELKALIDRLPDQAPWASFAKDLEEGLAGAANELRDEFVEQATRLVDRQTVAQVTQLAAKVKHIVDEAKKGGDQLLLQACDAISPTAGPAIKLVKLLSDPPQLPQLTIRTDSLECVFDDLKDQVETSPFVARLRELDAGIKELGLALPSRELLGNIVPESLKGIDFSTVIRNAALDFEDFFKKFKLPDLPESAIRVSHHVNPKTRSAQVKAEINHEFSSTESLFEISALSLDVRKPKLVATSNFEIGADRPGKASTNARFSGDLILNLGGQPLVTFVDANIQYSDSAGFKFDIDPKKIEPHSALKFIGDILHDAMPEMPENVEIIKNPAGIPVGAAITQNQEFGPLEFGAVSIGEAVLSSGFGLRIENGKMKIDTSFGIGKKESPVFIQVGAYGGGGWVTARAWAEFQGDVLQPHYDASIGVALGSAKSFTLAGVAHGSYALRMFIEAGFSSASNFFVAGLQLNGSARILGYLTAYLNLLVQVRHESGGKVTGRGQLDIKIKVCWCYTVRISRVVEQDM